MRVIKLRRPADAGGALDNGVNLALPTTSEQAVDLILARNPPAGGEVEPFGFARARHGTGIIEKAVKASIVSFRPRLAAVLQSAQSVLMEVRVGGL
jgi:hypothetical protein